MAGRLSDRAAGALGAHQTVFSMSSDLALPAGTNTATDKVGVSRLMLTTDITRAALGSPAKRAALGGGVNITPC